MLDNWDKGSNALPPMIPVVDQERIRPVSGSLLEPVEAKNEVDRQHRFI